MEGEIYLCKRLVKKVIFFRSTVSFLIGIVNVRECSKPWVLTLAVVTTYLALISVASGEQIRGSTEFQYITDNSGEGDQFFQRYNLNYGKTLSETLMYNMGLNAVINLQNDERSTQDLTPFFNINMDAPDLSANLGYTTDRREDSSGRTLSTNTFFVSLEPHLLKKYIHYSGNFNRRRTYDNLVPRGADLSIDSWRFALDHIVPVPQLDEVNLAYTLQQVITSNKLFNTKKEDLRGTLEMQFRGDIKDRITISGSMDLSGDRTRFSSPQPPFVAAFTPVGLFAVDLTPLTGGLANTPALVDGDLSTSTGISLQNNSNNIGADLAGERRTGLIYIYMTPGFLDLIGEVQWEVYSSNDGVNWTLVTNTPTVLYNIGVSRYEIEFTEQSTRFIKMVNVTTSTQPTADVTEIQVLALIPGLTKITETTQKEFDTDLRFVFRVTDDLSVNGSAFYTVNKMDPQEQQDTTTLFSGGLSYLPSKRFQLTLGANRSALRESSLSDTSSFVNSSYNMTFASQVKEILKPSVSLSLAQSLEDGEVVMRTKSGAMNLFFLDEI